MAKGNLDDLQKALDRKPETGTGPKGPTRGHVRRAGSYKAPSRENKTPITAYLSPDYKTSLRLDTGAARTAAFRRL